MTATPGRIGCPEGRGPQTHYSAAWIKRVVHLTRLTCRLCRTRKCAERPSTSELSPPSPCGSFVPYRLEDPSRQTDPSIDWKQNALAEQVTMWGPWLLTQPQRYLVDNLEAQFLRVEPPPPPPRGWRIPSIDLRLNVARWAR